MNQQDRSIMVTLTMVVSVLVLIAIAIFLISKLVSTLTIHTENDSRRISSIEDRIKPVYRVAVAATSAEATAAPATPAAPAQPAAPTMPAPTEKPAGSIVPANIDLAHGKQLYSTVCIACHSTGAAGAPKLTDKAGWAPRIAQGFNVLTEHAIKGIRGMPPKGGAANLPDQEIISAVGYMVSEAQ